MSLRLSLNQSHRKNLIKQCVLDKFGGEFNLLNCVLIAKANADECRLNAGTDSDVLDDGEPKKPPVR